MRTIQLVNSNNLKERQLHFDSIIHKVLQNILRN